MVTSLQDLLESDLDLAPIFKARALVEVDEKAYNTTRLRFVWLTIPCEICEEDFSVWFKSIYVGEVQQIVTVVREKFTHGFAELSETTSLRFLNGQQYQGCKIAVAKITAQSHKVKIIELLQKLSTPITSVVIREEKPKVLDKYVGWILSELQIEADAIAYAARFMEKGIEDDKRQLDETVAKRGHLEQKLQVFNESRDEIINDKANFIIRQRIELLEYSRTTNEKYKAMQAYFNELQQKYDKLNLETYAIENEIDDLKKTLTK